MSQSVTTAQRALAQTGASVQKLFAELPKTVETMLAEIQTHANTLADQETLIAANTTRIEAEVRSAGADIKLRVKEDSRKVLAELLQADGLAHITKTDLNALNGQLQAAQAAAEQTEFSAVKAAQSALHAQYGSKIKDLESDHKVANATMTANAQRDADLISSLRAQVASLEATITANREAETERTTALANSSVTVNNGKQ